MKLKNLLILALSLVSFAAYAQEGGIRGRVVSRAGRVALDNVKVTMTPGDATAVSDAQGDFLFENIPAGEYALTFEAAEFEPLEIAVRVDRMVRDINTVVLVPAAPQQVLDA